MSGTGRVRETPEVAAGAARMVRAVGKRAGTDVDSLIHLRELREECDRQIVAAAQAAHAYGWSWADIGGRLGISRQAAHERFSVKASLTDSAIAASGGDDA